MEKLFDNIEYAKMADKADAEQKKLYIWEHEIEYEVQVQDTKIEEREELRQKVDAETGEPLYHADGTPMMEKVIVEVVVPVYDEEGNPVMHTETRTKTIQELVIEPDGYYICREENITDGTLNPDFEEEETAKRKALFLKDFFKIPSAVKNADVYYRKLPKGYTSAVESINTAFNMVVTVGILPAGTLIFYEEPDFSKPEQCTEEWLINHQVKNEEMNTTEFGAFYAKFITAWNQQEHEN